MSFWSNFATCFGVGRMRPAPGTWGTLIAVPFAYGLALISPLASMGLIVALTFIAIYACQVYEKETNKHDHSEVVIDEFVGYLIAVMWLPLTWQSFLFAFVVFRFLDISKPLFIGKIDRMVPGGFGTMADDLAAALVTNVLLQAVFYHTNWLGVKWDGGFSL